MTLLSYFRTNRSLFARNTFALFAMVWVSLALQPCAMAYEVDNNPSMSAMSMDTDQPCDHCPEKATSTDCQFDDWGSPNQALNLSQDTKTPILLDKVIAVLALSYYIDSDKGRHLSPPASYPSNPTTPTQRQDILRC